MSEPSPQSQYLLDRVFFTADRLPQFDPNQGGIPLDLKGSVAELNIFENLELPYLTGSIAIVDDTSFKNTLGIKGSERLEIGIKGNESAEPIIKKFMITGVASNVSVNERTDVHILTLIEEHGFLSAINKISQSYTGIPEEIITNILKSHLNKDIFFNSNVAKQSRMKVNIPFWNPLQAADWLRDRMAFSNGSPYFLYSSLKDDNLHLDDLDTLMKDTAWNEDDPYTYAEGSHNFTVGTDIKRRELFHVKSYKASSIESTLRLAQAGAIGSEFKVMDLTSSTQLSDSFHNSNDTLNRFIQSIENNADISSSLGYDNSLVIGPTENKSLNIGSYPSKVFSSVVATRQFYEVDEKTPISGYHDENEQSNLYKLKIRSAALRSILMNNVFQITVPGQPYIVNREIGIGSNILLNYAAPTQASESLNSETGSIDKNRSGKFLVYRTRHRFSEGIYDVMMDVVKLTDKTK